MKKILLSIATLAIVGAVVVGATGAFYGDVETSTGNTFTAGSLELKVDSTSHYNGMVCTDGGWQPSDNPQEFGSPVGFPAQGTDCSGTWAETNLEDGVHTFFNFLDLKPGDHGENTISVHVYNNDAWGQFVIDGIIDRDNTCTDPEKDIEGDDCVDPDGDGEIDNNLRFTGWLDQGQIAGFQNVHPDGNGGYVNDPTIDPTEGDNIYQEWEGPLFWDDTLIGDLGPFDLAEVFSAAYQLYCTQASPIGHNDYELCHGLAEDGRMVGSTTYYFGLAWDLDLMGTGNEVQSDEYTADLTFRIEQQRNNPNPFAVPTP